MRFTSNLVEDFFRRTFQLLQSWRNYQYSSQVTQRATDHNTENFNRMVSFSKIWFLYGDAMNDASGTLSAFFVQT